MSVRLFCKSASGTRFHLNISLLCVDCQWQEIPIGQVGVGNEAWCGCILANPPASRKQASLISLNIPVQYGKNYKTTPRHFLGLDLHVLSIRAQSIT